MPSRDIFIPASVGGGGGLGQLGVPHRRRCCPLAWDAPNAFWDPQLLFVTPKRLGVYPKSRDKFSGGKMLAARSHVGKMVFVETWNLHGKHKNAEGIP